MVILFLIYQLAGRLFHMWVSLLFWWLSGLYPHENTIPTHARHLCHAVLTHGATAHSYRAFQTLYEDRTHNPSGRNQQTEKLGPIISKDGYRSWVLQFSASLALNSIISRHLLLQVKLSISSSVERKKQTKKIPNWKITQKQSRKIWGLSWKIWAHADCSWTRSKLLARHKRLWTTRSFPFQRKEKTLGFVLLNFFLVSLSNTTNKHRIC